ncbi:hypothetical protein NQT74_01325 [Alteromonas stellipolaris]|uniref:hypothetical protein n=1 Tax=Alteromonas stellipolaris TaxID=233316 RepID=UPI002118FD82|nr:hypothetical protein [Alteromonas stellipolaris]MCQ8847220.1 hypothetical protein [Alteromonas stellipolaris]
MKNKFFKAVLAFCVLSASLNSNAALIVDGVEVEALEINESLESFYNFSSSNYSANTGYELANQLVGFFATDSTDTLGLYLIFGGPGSDAGNVNFDLSANDGEIIYVDDPNAATRSDTVLATSTGYSVDFIYGANRTDGLIFSNFTGDVWDFALSFNETLGIDSFSFLTFDDSGVDSVAVFSDVVDNISISSVSSAPNSPIAVSAPTTLMILALSLSCIFASRRKLS